MIELHNGSEWFLLLLALLPVLWILQRRPDRQTAVRFSAIDRLQRQPASWAVRARRALPVLRMLWCALLILCLARPQQANEQTRVRAEGIAIQMLVDRSGSMQAMDFRLDGQAVDRLTAVKKVVSDFVMGRGELPGRPNDLIGLIAFGTYADGMCPLTLDHEHLIRTLEATEIATTQEEGNTAIGDALALGVEYLRMIETTGRVERGIKVNSKAIILLTDGENTAGDIEPLQAAEIAAAFGIKVYAIGAGTDGMAPMPARDIFGRTIMQNVAVTIDEETLRKIAEITGGRYFRATDTASLEDVYAEIDALEKSELEEKRYMQYKELATTPWQWGPAPMPPLLLVVLTLLVVDTVLGHTWLRKLP